MCEVIKARDREEKRRHLGLEGCEDVHLAFMFIHHRHRRLLPSVLTSPLSLNGSPSLKTRAAAAVSRPAHVAIASPRVAEGADLFCS